MSFNLIDIMFLYSVNGVKSFLIETNCQQYIKINALNLIMA